MTENQGQDDGEHGPGQGRDAGRVELAAGLATVGRQPVQGEDKQENSDRHVEQEDRAPGAAEQVGTDERTAGHLADDSAQGNGRRVHPQRLGPRRAGEVPLDQAHHLGHHHPGADTLGQPETDQLPG